MKKLISQTFLILLGCFFAGGLVGQSEVKVLDLAVVPALEQTGMSADSIKLVVMFKISNANQALKTHFWLGTAKDSSNILTVEPVFSTVNSITTLSFGGSSIDVKNYAVGFYLITSKTNYNGFSAATMFVEATNGQMTSRLYYIK